MIDTNSDKNLDQKFNHRGHRGHIIAADRAYDTHKSHLHNNTE